MNKKKSKKIKLDLSVRPIAYHIKLKPDLEAHVFSGEEMVEVRVEKPIKEITLHSKDLDISDVFLKIGKDKFTAKVSYDDLLETATFSFQKKIIPGKYKLYIIFRGILSSNMRGFYKSHYVVDGKTKTMATTQFEATDARRCIPCFDEPVHKAVFHVKLIVPLDKEAISNTLPISTEHESGFKVVSFAPTPKMSTYLLAFIVGDFEYVEKKTKNGVLVRVYVTPGKKHQTLFALDTAVKCLEFYEDYFDIKYPLNTLDMIAIPDFASGAMENWGAVTYRETALLVDGEHTSARTRQWVALVIAHELAHQWFGNLVTMEWWTHLWLNEGFASYIEYLAVDHLFPEWNIWTQFAYADLGVAMRLDSLQNTHPIEVDVHDPNEIGEIFDAVSYSKGASVIRMLAGYLGEENFRDGLRHYLKKHSYKNAETIHLWESFEKVSKKPIKKMMENWTRKSGYPVVSIKSPQVGPGQREFFEITQSRFFSSSVSAKKIKDNTLWHIPFNYSGDRSKVYSSLFNKKKEKIVKSEDFWRKFNFGETGFYRVKYDLKSLSDLEIPIQEGRLGAIDRLGIVRDLFAFAESGNGSTVEALSFAKNYKGDTDYTVWVEVLSGLLHVYNLVSNTPLEENYKKYALSIITDYAQNIGWDKKTNEDHTTTMLRSSILFHAGMYGDQKIIKQAFKIFKNKNIQPIDADVRGTIYNLVALYGGDVEYKELLSIYHTSPVHEEKNRVLHALGQFSQNNLVEKTLKFALSKEVRLQDRNGIFGSLISNPKTIKTTWSFIKNNWKQIVSEYGEGGHLLARLINPLNHFSDKKDAQDVEKFFKKNKAPGATRTIEQILEHIYSNDAWKKRDLKGIGRFLGKI
jgi:puromycin-sensitive aminopeptidase